MTDSREHRDRRVSALDKLAPYGPGVMPNDARWMKIVRWSVFAVVDAEELGLSSGTIDQALASDDPNVQRFVGKAGGFGAMPGVDADWAFKIVKQVGNYNDPLHQPVGGTPEGPHRRRRRRADQ